MASGRKNIEMKNRHPVAKRSFGFSFRLREAG